MGGVLTRRVPPRYIKRMPENRATKIPAHLLERTPVKNRKERRAAAKINRKVRMH
jgi:hypothetical protein